MVERGAGVSVLSALAVREEVAAGRLLTFEMDAEGLKRDIYLVTRKSERYTELEQQFLRFCRRFSPDTDVIE
jgi:DNA-binding transcriptional LysR family regulator